MSRTLKPHFSRMLTLAFLTTIGNSLDRIPEALECGVREHKKIQGIFCSGENRRFFLHPKVRTLFKVW